jgi:tetratricopeptide (TPR) repeat protein
MTAIGPLGLSAGLAQTLSAVEAALWARDMQGAMALSERAVAGGAEHPTLLSLAALGRMRAGANDSALPLLLRARLQLPHHVDLLNALGECLSRLGRPREAVEAFDAGLAITQEARLHFGRALALEELSELDTARAAFEQALALNPAQSEALSRLAVLAIQRGDTKAAKAFAMRALAIDANDVAAGIAMVQMALEEKDLATAERIVAVIARLPNLGAVNRAFALSLAGDVLDARGRPAEAFAAYVQSKAILREAYAPKMEGLESVTARELRLAEYFFAADPARWQTAAPEPQHSHVFLVGFPRSGTTLLEQVLASHPEVTAMEERTCLEDSAIAFFGRNTDLDRLAALSGAELEPWRQAYWKRVEQVGITPSSPVFVDKMPLNAVFLPLIAKLFPSAKIILALRDPRDVVLSCLRRRFAMNPGMYEFTTLETTTAYYVAVMRLIAVYRGKLALEVIESRHESLVADFEQETRRLCGFLGLSWLPQMAGFASRAGAQNIDTPSSAQVARGLSDAGLAQWRRYATELEPILPLLAPFVRQFGYPES